MIEQIEDPNLFDDWKKKDIYTVRILALLKSYGTAYRFATFYRQIIDGKITAILSKLDNDVTLALDDGTLFLHNGSRNYFVRPCLSNRRKV